MVKTKRTVMTLALGLLLVLFSTAFAAVPTQASGSRTASASTSFSQPLQSGWSGWSQVPGHGSTPDSPARAVLHGTTLYLFVRGTNDHLYVNTSNGPTWSGWSEVPGRGLTLSGPTAATHVPLEAVYLYLFVRGTNNHLYVNTLGGTAWSGWSEVPGHGLTPDAPGATAFLTSDLGPSQLNLFVRGTNDRIYVNILQTPA